MTTPQNIGNPKLTNGMLFWDELDPNKKYNFGHDPHDPVWDGWREYNGVAPLPSDRLEAFSRPTETNKKTKEGIDGHRVELAFRIQDSYIHHKRVWQGQCGDYDHNYPVKILFLSTAKKSDIKFGRYKKYTPNLNGYFDAADKDKKEGESENG